MFDALEYFFFDDYDVDLSGITTVLLPAMGGGTYIFSDGYDVIEDLVEDICDPEFDEEDDEDEFLDAAPEEVTETEEFDEMEWNAGATFSGIFLVNFLGMFPGGSGLGGGLIGIFIFSFCSFLFLNIYGVEKHGFYFFSLFLPTGTPLIMSPFIILIEIVSYLARIFSISIRLFANLMSGHTLLKILMSFAWILFLSGTIFSFFFFFPFLIIFAVFLLECMIAVLQAFVYTLLFNIYFVDVYKLH